jgi:hypothetical protein
MSMKILSGKIAVIAGGPRGAGRICYSCYEIVPICKLQGGGDVTNAGSLAGTNPFAREADHNGGMGYMPPLTILNRVEIRPPMPSKLGRETKESNRTILSAVDTVPKGLGNFGIRRAQYSSGGANIWCG